MSEEEEAPQTPTIGRPMIGPKHYVFRGYSGLPETFRRTEADEILQRTLGNIPLESVLGPLRGNVLSYPIVRDRLATALGVSLETADRVIPLPAIVSLWARAGA